MDKVLEKRLDWMKNEVDGTSPTFSEALKYFAKDPEKGEKEAHEGHLVARIHLKDGNPVDVRSQR